MTDETFMKDQEPSVSQDQPVEQSLFQEQEGDKVETTEQDKPKPVDVSNLVFKFNDELYRVLTVKQLTIKDEPVEICMIQNIITNLIDMVDAFTLMSQYRVVSPIEVVDAFNNHMQANSCNKPVPVVENPLKAN